MFADAAKTAVRTCAHLNSPGFRRGEITVVMADGINRERLLVLPDGPLTAGVTAAEASERAIAAAVQYADERFPEWDHVTVAVDRADGERVRKTVHRKDIAATAAS